MKKFPETASNWARKCNVERESIYGGSFNGNSCRSFEN